MPRRKGSTKALPSLAQTDVAAFEQVSQDIKELGISSVATLGNISLTTIYSFLRGESIGPLAESAIKSGLRKARSKQKRRSAQWH